MPTEPKSDFSSVFTRFKDMLGKYADENLHIRWGKPDQCELIGPPTPRSLGREVWFGAAQIGKRYVSYHLMPVYAFPDLLDGISPELKKRMQGKSCFNFTHVDEKLFKELEVLTEQGYERFKREGLIDKP
jgi:hypothetical protein